MDDARQRLATSWLTKAQHDLGSARKLSTGETPYLDTAVYHCQQAAEKALKAVLVHYDRPFPRAHDLSLQLAVEEDGSFSELTDSAEQLTPYATEYRYSSDVPDPGHEECQQATEAASRVVAFVVDRLPADYSQQ